MGAPRARLSPHSRLRSGSWISLFAMLMIFIGPLISQAMPMDHHAGMSMSMDMPMEHGETHHKQAPDEHHALWSKCGYCDLLYSCPALPGGISTFTLSSPPPASALTPATRLGHARQSIFPGARSRAPPIAS
ncbi:MULTISPECIES: DUF2946 domain-containing protein [Pseudomonas]|uniref:DUF2946 domain-containing protein n=1 Tax=Pseudomonas TaxID=286 RepID=UPI00098EAD26|nr:MULTISPECIES: DUF2946 domain-containing protein [Pseudomonas]AQT92294.1 hypothetical protein B1R45_03125 [Pseudomonas azotoformans]MBT1263041.1 DUF2946 domain-containing protein [Pseudomonas sp. VS40]MBT1274956.1 DUF2946 domain-containing protein [Pseudomonas sp. VS59]UMY50061.1 DUF2946 domain-containing protein [Pseudomonas azotoformans]